MCTVKSAVKILSLLTVAMFFSTPSSSGEKASRPHMMYFYNPSCRLCTKTNETVAATESKFEGRMGTQRFNIADAKTGTDNVLYMFELMDELEVPEEGNVTLVVFLGVLEEEDGEYYFIPRRALLEEKIIETLDQEAEDFLAGEEEGSKLGLNRPASFFLPYGPRVAGAS